MSVTSTSEVLDYVVAQARQIDATKAELRRLVVERDGLKEKHDEMQVQFTRQTAYVARLLASIGDVADALSKGGVRWADNHVARVEELLKSRDTALAERDECMEKLDRLLRETVPLATESTDPDEGMDKIRCATCTHAMERHRLGAGCSVVGCDCKYGGDQDPDADDKDSIRCHRCSHTVARHTGYECSVGDCPCVAVARNLPHPAE